MFNNFMKKMGVQEVACSCPWALYMYMTIIFSNIFSETSWPRKAKYQVSVTGPLVICFFVQICFSQSTIFKRTKPFSSDRARRASKGEAPCPHFENENPPCSFGLPKAAPCFKIFKSSVIFYISGINSHYLLKF